MIGKLACVALHCNGHQNLFGSEAYCLVRSFFGSASSALAISRRCQTEESDKRQRTGQGGWTEKKESSLPRVDLGLNKPAMIGRPILSLSASSNCARTSARTEVPL